MKKVTTKELTAFRDHAVATLTRMPVRAKLPGAVKPMTEAERVSLAQLSAAMYVLGSLGVDTNGVALVLEHADSDTST